MGSTKTNTTTTSTPTATPQESEYNQLKLEQQRQINPAQTQMMQNAFGLGNQLLTSFGNQGSSMWQSLIGGVTPQQQQSMVSEADRYLKPQLQSQGIYDSGMAATARMRSATDIYNQNAQFNVGALQNALNLALSGQAQVQSPALGASSQLGQQLAGLRSYSGMSQQQQFANPFQMAIQGIGAAGQLATGIGGFMKGK